MNISCRKVELHASELHHCSFIVKAAMGLSLHVKLCKILVFSDFETNTENDWQQLGN